MSKKISVIVKYFYPVAAGIETNILETYSVLARDGWDVTIYTSSDSLTQHAIYPKEETIRGLKIRRMDVKTWLWFPEGIDWRGSDIIALHNFNVMPHFLIMLYAWYLKIQNKKHFALVLTPHGGFNPEWRIFSPAIAFAKKLYHFTVGVFLISRSVDGMRAVSEWEREEIIKKGVDAHRVSVISNGMEDEAYMDVDQLASDDVKEKVASYGRYIIQIGRIYMIKNYETSIRALSQIPEHDVKFVIAGPIGDETYKQKLEKLIKELKLEDRVIFAGVIRGVDKYYLIKHAQMMVHMALWESFCNVVHEGMSQGLPCLVANNTALPYLIKDGINGYLINTHDEQKLAEKISYILNNQSSQEIAEMKQRNIEFGLQHSWQSTARKMGEWYDALMAQNG